MAITVSRPKLTWFERLYFPAIVSGMAITIKHFVNMLLGRTKVTMQYPEEKWDSSMPEHYRGAPALVRDESGRVRCVACQLCEFICPPRAIKIVPGEISERDRFAKVEKYPEEFDIDMIRCIYCGMCEEVCPEQAIFLRKDYAITGTDPRRDGARQAEIARDRRCHARRRSEVERKEMNAVIPSESEGPHFAGRSHARSSTAFRMTA